MTIPTPKFEFEENSPRLAKRYQGRLSIRYQGQEMEIGDWSATGCLLKTRELDPEQRLTLEVPCEDGGISLSVRFQVIRSGEDGTALRFVFDDAADSAVLAAHALNVETREPSLKEELLNAGRPVLMEELRQEAEAREAHKAKWGRLVPFLVTILVIVGIGSIIVPHIRSQLAMKIGERERYVTLATNRLEVAKLQQRALTQRMTHARSIVEKTRVPLSAEQQTLFDLGIGQLEGEIELQSVHIEMLKANLAAVRGGNFFYEKEALGPFSAHIEMDAAPFLTQLLAEIADESRYYPKTPEDIKRYQQVARQRYENALAEFETNKTRIATLDEFHQRYKGLAARGAISQNTLLFLKRDRQLLAIEAQRLASSLELLKENWENAMANNFTLELRLLDKFNPSPNPPPSISDYNFVR